MSENWYEHKETTNLGYKLMFLTLKILPSIFMRFLAFFIGFFYWLFDKRTRRVSKYYLSKVGKSSSLKHVISFALNLVENVQSWAGKFSFKNVSWQDDDVNDLVEKINSAKGCLIIMSHLGNSQMLKGLASFGESGTEKKMSITTITDAELTSGFGALIQKINPDSNFHIISSNNIGPDTIFLLQERLEKGEVVVIAGDRIGAHSDRYIELDFLGEKARFPYGVFLLTALLNVPTYFVNGLRHKDLTLNPQYDMFVKKSEIDFDCGRKEREERIRATAEKYAENLAELAKKHPFQWYNFFDFWDL